MYHKEKSIQIRNSASALYNNLGVLRIAPHRLTYFTVVHANVVNVVSASWDGLNYSHRELQSKEPNVATSTSLIMQVTATFQLLLCFPNPFQTIAWYAFKDPPGVNAPEISTSLLIAQLHWVRKCRFNVTDLH